MKTTPTIRQKTEHARRKAMGLALIQRPLRFIASRTNSVKIENGVTMVMQSDLFRYAKLCANMGDGGAVNRAARSVL